MAYNKISNKTQEKDIKYLNKDFNSFRSNLLEFSKTYFPNTFNDFTEGSPGMMFMEMAAYVGDVLSFYTDTQLREVFLQLAEDKENLYNLAYSLGYKPKNSTAASVILDVTQLVPSKLTDGIYKPDYDYALNIQENSTFETAQGINFYTSQDINFSFSSSFDPTTVSIYNYDSSNNPEYYLLKKKTIAISGETKTKNFPIGSVEKFKTLSLFAQNFLSIESIVDSDGNEWSEVPYLAQDTIFEEVPNNAANDPDLFHYNNQTPFLLKLKKSTKRFITRINPNDIIEIQFGAGTNDKADEQIIPNPDNIGLGIKDGRSKLDVAYDPSNFLVTKTYGEAPSNTTLTVTYLVGGGLEANVNSNEIIYKGSLNLSTKTQLNNSMISFVKSSIGVTNLEAATGGGDGDTPEELKMNISSHFAAQNRTVTKEDYIIRTLNLSPKLGRVTKAYIQQDDQLSPLTNEPNRIPNPLALNLYTLGYNNQKQLITLNTATKTNLSTYLEQYRMLTDAINIKDAFIINFTIDFTITTFKSYNNQEVLLQCITELQNYFDIDKWQINQPIIISEVENLIGGIKGVQTVEDVKFENKNGEILGYSKYKYGFEKATLNKIIYPSMDPSIFEIKYPNSDIQGKVTTY